MKLFRSMRLMVLALFLCVVPATSFAGVFISVGFAPPMLPVYEQPLCPEPGLMWTPGYWAYGPDGYYWVPGAWVEAPYSGALWTPGYWGFETSFYVWHPGYWGNRVGYYGGVNYGFGYMGMGFSGGYWRNGSFMYNTAVMRVDSNRFRGRFYEDRNIVQRNTIMRDSHVSYNGGSGGIRYRPSSSERQTFNDRRIGATTYQSQFENKARADHNAYANRNNGRPSNSTLAQPMDVQRQVFQPRQSPQQYQTQPGRTMPQQQPQQQQQYQRQPQAQPQQPQQQQQRQPQAQPQQQQQRQPQYQPQQRQQQEQQPTYQHQQRQQQEQQHQQAAPQSRPMGQHQSPPKEEHPKK